MFFICTHTWDLKDEETVSKEFIKIFFGAFYRTIGNPWPKLFYAWHHPKEPKMTTLWESSTPQALANLFTESTFKTEQVHVRQLFPPYVDGWNAMSIKTQTE